jgi:hypothetical protein
LCTDTVLALVKNTLLGAAVFETYEQLLIKFSDNHESEHDILLDGGDVYAKTSLSEHFCSGFGAGSAHGVLSVTMDILQQQTNNSQTRTRGSIISNGKPDFASLWVGRGSYTMHHAISHAFLFSSYEWCKRNMNLVLLDVDDSSSKKEKKESIFDTVYGDVFVIGLAGGIAGQVQTFVSHYTELWSSTCSSASNSDGRMQNPNGETLKQSLKKYPLPSVRSLVLSFPASAIGFVAFEFGKDMMNSKG